MMGTVGEKKRHVELMEEKMILLRKTLSETEVTVKLKNGEKRRRKQYRFGYYENGRRVNGAIQKRAEGLAIPPAGRDVVIDLAPKAKIVARWVDEKDRPCALYSKAHNKKAAMSKFSRVKRFEEALPQIMKAIKKEIIKKGTSKEREAANVLYLIAQTAFRLGGTNNTRADKAAFGASTLLGKHATVDRGTVVFDFVGKKGVRNHQTTHDRLINKMIRERKTPRWSERLFNVSPGFVRGYLQGIAPGFVVKDFRTCLATRLARELTAQRKGPAPSQTRFRRWQRQVADKVAKKLGNTRSVALNAYINPSVWRHWEQPKLWPPFLPKCMKGDE